MATIEHSALTTGELHEPKGAASAAVGTVYTADGSGSGSWKNNDYTIYVSMTDVSTFNKLYIPTPFAGTVISVQSVIDGALATADATVTVKNSAGASMGTMTLAFSGSAAGDVDTLSPSTNNTLTANGYMTIESDGASTNVVRANFVVVVRRS